MRTDIGDRGEEGRANDSEAETEKKRGEGRLGRCIPTPQGRREREGESEGGWEQGRKGNVGDVTHTVRGKFIQSGPHIDAPTDAKRE